MKYGAVAAPDKMAMMIRMATAADIRDFDCEAQLPYACRANVQKRSKKAWRDNSPDVGDYASENQALAQEV
ncbi:hypothetical protein [Actinoplanes sp. NPDC020271]|uniref:hypothetical protein n=1 Tax=Actinoplanes sp. NPDC020271 TaxID=3363896 RepID=UPI0037AC4ABA